MALYEIPLKPTPQAFAITLGGTEYRMRLTYCDAADGGWLLDIGDTNGAPLACGIPLVTGIDLLAQYRHLDIGGSLWVATPGHPSAVPTFAGLGAASKLLFEGA